MQCRICKNEDNHTHHTAREMMLGLRDEHEYFECGACGCLQITSIPENIQDYYPGDDYYSYDAVKSASGVKKTLIKLRDHYAATGKGLIGRLLQQRMPHDKLPALQHANVNEQSRILDVGCGAGHLLHSLRDCGFENTLGIDPFNDKPLSYDNGLKIEPKSIHDVSDGNWDLIMMNHAFEHVADQHETLQKIASLLKPGGICMLRIPTVSSWAWRHYGVEWAQLDAPRHLFLHSTASVEHLAQACGLTLDKTVFDSFAFQFWGSEQYRKDISLHDERSYSVNPDKSPFSEEQIAEYQARSAELNKQQEGDQAAFYLKKPLAS